MSLKTNSVIFNDAKAVVGITLSQVSRQILRNHFHHLLTYKWKTGGREGKKWNTNFHIPQTLHFGLQVCTVTVIEAGKRTNCYILGLDQFIAIYRLHLMRNCPLKWPCNLGITSAGWSLCIREIASRPLESLPFSCQICFMGMSYFWNRNSPFWRKSAQKLLSWETEA